MGMFQNSVLNKYLKTQDKQLVDEAYGVYVRCFHNAKMQDEIRLMKEEEYQDGFLDDLFVAVLGYVKRPKEGYNLVREKKNETDGKKADGAVVRGDDIIAVIELKGTDTKDLGLITEQAFGYKNNHQKCEYVVCSNFEKLRFYVQNAVEYIEFDLFNLNREDFGLLWLCLQADNLLTDIPQKLKKESVVAEENITKELYKDYVGFKTELWQNVCANSPEKDKLLMFKKTQKLLDRFLFIFFAEDSGLLPPNSISRMVERYEKLIELDAEKPLYEIFKQYFSYINKGRKGKSSEDDIFAYNGGLFEADAEIDAFVIDDALLKKHVMKLTAYDFESEVDVNVLGHIFEHSLNEIENVTAMLEGKEVEKGKTKRKKDGVFYTPKYITKYIVENTVGKLCAEKKTELNITDERFGQASKRSKKGIEDLEAYRNWLLGLKICDPACGSGAFLNQALEFLMDEHRYLDELTAQYHKVPLVLSDIENHILEKNIYGVDINEESVEIAKLSLWLRTAQRGRKLSSLNNNIKCGNSLIDDVAVAGEKAFVWQKEFPHVFKEKEKKAWHITTATHDSRTSQRMIDHKVREKRDGGLRPNAEGIWMDEKAELLVSETIAKIVKEDDLRVMAYSICGDHIHLLLVCGEDEISSIVGKIKAVSAKEYNAAKVRSKENASVSTGGDASHATREDAFPSTREDAFPSTGGDASHATGEDAFPSTRERAFPSTRGHVPLSKEGKEGKKEKHVSLWTQKFGCKEVVDEKQLWNTVEYIQNNRAKHGLAVVDGLDAVVEGMCCSFDEAFGVEWGGGFDVVIGNPPYVFARDNISQELKDYYMNNYVSAEYQVNTYLLFIEQSINIIKNNANYGLIIPNAWLMVGSARGLRNHILQNCSIGKIINLSGYSFEGVSVETIILLATKTKQKAENNSIEVLLSDDKEFRYSHDRKQIDFEKNEGFEFKVFSDEISVALTKKIKNKSKNLDDLVLIKAGLKAYEKNKGEPKQTVEDVKNRPFDYNYKYDENTHKYLEGKDVGRYLINWSGQYLQYGKQLAAPRTFNLFDGEKIIIREITGKFPKSIISTYSNELYLFNMSNIAIIEREELNISLKYIVSVLNSKLMAYYFVKNTAKSVRKMFPKIILNDLRKFPFKEIEKDAQQPFIDKADKMLEMNKCLQDKINNFIKYLQSQYAIEKLSTKLQHWYELDFGDFIKELNKAIKAKGKENSKGTCPLVKKEEMEWMELFEEKKAEVVALQAEIDKTDREIDRMVYELYGLTEEEVRIVEQS